MALREYVQDRNPDPWVPRSGWWSTGRTAQRAWFIARRLPTEDQEAPPFVQIVAEPRPPGWQVIYHEDCRPMADVGKLNIGIWEFGAFAPPSASSRRFPVAVHEPACSSGRGPAGRVREPTIVYRETEIYIVFTITPLRGTQDCPGAPAARAVVELREPIGDRKLVDASTYPFHDPNEPPF